MIALKLHSTCFTIIELLLTFLALLKVECKRKLKASEQRAQRAEAELEAKTRQLEGEAAQRAREAQVREEELAQGSQAADTNGKCWLRCVVFLLQSKRL